MTPVSTHDVIVVGGRLAGAATAMLLARAGLDVLVLERARYGSDILSTHALMRAGVIQLSRWGILDDVRAAGTPPIPRTTIRYGGPEEVVEIKPIPHCDALYAPRRTLLDRALADAAMRAGADVRFRHAVEHLTVADDGLVTGVVFRDHRGRRHQARAAVTVGADGPRSLVARSTGAASLVAGRNASALAVGYWSGVEADGYQWLYAPGAAAGVIPTNDGQVCAWVSVPSHRFDDTLRPDLAGGLRRVLTHVAPDWLARLDRGVQHGPIRGFAGIAGHLRRAGGPGWALVGDAGYFKDPITAHGMTDALRDAELLADALVGGLGDPVRGLADAIRSYQDVRDRLSWDLLHLADRIAAYDWSMEELRELLLSLSLSMRDEVAHVSGRNGAEVGA